MFNDNTNISKILDWINNYKEILDLIGDSTDNKTIMSLLKQSLIEDIENMINGNWKSIRFRLKNSIHTKGYGNYGEKEKRIINVINKYRSRSLSKYRKLVFSRIRIKKFKNFKIKI